MEITLEKIELVKDRTGVSYKEAKEALEAAGGSVVDAIINIEESSDYDIPDESEAASSSKELFDKIKKTAARGNMSRIIVRRGNNVLLNIPLTVSIIGAVIAPWGVIFGVIAAAGFNCKVEFVNDRGQTTDVNGRVKTEYKRAKTQGQRIYDIGQENVNKIKENETYKDLRNKGQEAIDKIKENETYKDLVEKGSDVLDDLKDKSQEAIDKIKEIDSIDDLKEASAEFLDDLKDKGQETIDKIKESDVYENLNVKDNIEEIRRVSEELFKKKTKEAPSQDEIDSDLENLDKILEEVERENGLDETEE